MERFVQTVKSLHIKIFDRVKDTSGLFLRPFQVFQKNHFSIHLNKCFQLVNTLGEAQKLFITQFRNNVLFFNYKVGIINSIPESIFQLTCTCSKPTIETLEKV